MRTPVTAAMLFLGCAVALADPKAPASGEASLTRDKIKAMHTALKSDLSAVRGSRGLQHRAELSELLFRITTFLDLAEGAPDAEQRQLAIREATELSKRAVREYAVFQARLARPPETPRAVDDFSIAEDVSKAYVRVFYATVRKPLEKVQPTAHAPRDNLAGPADQGWLRRHQENFKPVSPVQNAARSAAHLRFTEELAELTLGQCEVEITVPTVVLKSMNVKHYEVRVEAGLSAELNLKLVPQMSETMFVSKLKQRVARSQGREVFVFVHGYRNSFRDAMVATAHMAFAFQHDGAPIAFAWPSNTGLSSAGYVKAQSHSDVAADALADFLRSVVQQSRPERIHLIAHSMGARLLSRALEKIANSGGTSEKDVSRSLPLKSAVLTAADVDREEFLTRHADRVLAVSNSLVFYVASNDTVLRFSKILNDGRPRLGDSGGKVPLMNGALTIDVSEATQGKDMITTHSYHMRTPPVVADLDGLLRGIGAADRGLQQRKDSSGGTYYFLESSRK